MTSVLITGANRGIGLELVERMLKHDHPPSVLIATARDPAAAEKLNELKSLGNLQVLQLDVDRSESFAQFAKEVGSIVGAKGLNVLINNAGIMPPVEIETAVSEDFMKVYRTNTIGPILLTQALLPLIKTAAAAKSDSPPSMARAAILNMSSMLGSVTLNRGGHWAYRESKAALNMASRSLAISLSDTGILVTVLHPGWVRTELGGADADISVEECGQGLMEVIYSLDASKHNKFIQWDGQELPW